MKSDILKKLEQTIKKKSLSDVNAIHAKDFVNVFKDFMSQKDSKSRFFSVNFQPVGDEHDDGIILLKFASARKSDNHNEIMKNAKTKFIISIDGFDRKGKCKGNGKCRLVLFHKNNRNGERREWEESNKVDTEGTHSEILRHLLSYFDANLVRFTDSAIKFVKGEDTEEFHEDVCATGTVSSPVTVGIGETIGNKIDLVSQEDMKGIARVPHKLKNNKKRKDNVTER